LRDKKKRPKRRKTVEDDEGEDRNDSESGKYGPTTLKSKPKGEARRFEVRGRGVRIVEDEWTRSHGTFAATATFITVALPFD
jgi:hypothetical protein